MCRGLATRFYRYRSGGVVVHAYQTPGTLSPNLCYWSSSLCGVCFTKIISLSLSFLFLSAINHMILVVEYGKKNCKGWILFDGKHIYIYLYIALNIFINMYVIMRDWDIVFICHSYAPFLVLHYLLTCISMTHWVPKRQKY